MGLNPEGLPIVDNEGTHGVFKNNKFNWNANESKFNPYAELAKMVGTPKNPDKKDFDAVEEIFRKITPVPGFNVILKMKFTGEK